MSQAQPETEYISNLMMDAIDALHNAEQVLNRVANRCAGWSSSFSLDLERAIEHTQEFMGELESLMNDAEAFDNANEAEE